MTRAKNTVARKHRVKRILKKAKGYFGRKKNLFSVAKQNVVRAGMYAFAHRRKKKGQFGRLWNVRINAGLKEIDEKLSYARFVHMKNQQNIKLDRKLLAFLATEQPSVFSEVVKAVREKK